MDNLLKLEGQVYTCKYCDAHLALEEDAFCKGVMDFMFRKMENVVLGEKYYQDVSNGRHFFKDVHCAGCGSLLGFKYEVLPPVYNNLLEPHYKAGDFSVKRAEILGPVAFAHPPPLQDQGEEGTDFIPDIRYVI